MKPTMYGFINIEKLRNTPKKKDIVRIAATHNKREETRRNPAIDAGRSHLNQVLRGPDTAAEIIARFNQRMANAGIIKNKSSAVLLLEIVSSLPIGSGIDPLAFSEDFTIWASQRFGGDENILSSDVHRDESADHCHILIIPLVNGKMNGSDMMGGSDTLEGHIKSFYCYVGEKYGLTRPPPPLKGIDKQAAAELVLEKINAFNNPASDPAVWTAICKLLAKFPDSLLEPLGLERPNTAKPKKTFEQIVLSTGKGPKTEAAAAFKDAQLEKPRPIPDPQADASPDGESGTFPLREADTEKGLSLTCVRKPQKSQSQPAREDWQNFTDHPRRLPPRNGPETFRDRESERPTSDFDENRGEHIRRSPPPMQYLKAEAVALAALLRPGGSWAIK